MRGASRSMQQLIANLASRAEQVIDARASERYQGTVAEPRPGLRSGHIPGSRNLPYNNLFDAATGTMKSLDELRAAFSGAGVEARRADRDQLRLRRPAAVLTLALYRLGVENPALYDGSWTEWGAPTARRSRPVRPDPESRRLARRCARPGMRERIGLRCC